MEMFRRITTYILLLISLGTLFMTLTIVEKEELFLPDVILFGAYAFLLIWIGVDIYGVFRRLFRLD